MRILFIDFTIPYFLKDSSYPIGGWAVELSAWIDGLCANDNQIGVLTWSGANKFIEKEIEYDLIETYDPAKGIKAIKYLYYYVPSLYEQTKKYKPDIIIQACAGLYTGIMAIIAESLQIPFVYRVANDKDTDDRYKVSLSGYEQIAYRYGLSKSVAILCQNEYQLTNIRNKYPATPSSIIHNPFSEKSSIDLTRYRNETEKYIAWLGVFSSQKNLPLLFKIARESPEIKIKVAGMPAKSIDENTRKALTNLGNLPNVEFLGYLTRRDVPAFLFKAVALLNTSHYEGFSNTFLEAFSVGTPVITSESVDPDNIIAKNGLGISVRNNNAFPAAVKELFEDKDKCQRLGTKCREYVQLNHNPAILARELTMFIEEKCNI